MLPVLTVCINEIFPNLPPFGQDLYHIWCLQCTVMTDFIDGFYKKTPRLAEIALHISLSLTIESMSADCELQELLREFEQMGLQNLMSNASASTPREETPPAPPQPMQTRSTRKKFKPEVCSKQNEDRHKQSGKTSEDPKMNPSGLAEIPSEGDENIALQRPPYLHPVRPRVQPPQRNAKFMLRTPSLPQGMQLVRTMTGKID